MRKQPLFIYEVISVRFKFYCRSLLSVKKTCFFLFNFIQRQLKTVASPVNRNLILKNNHLTYL